MILDKQLPRTLLTNLRATIVVVIRVQLTPERKILVSPILLITKGGITRWTLFTNLEWLPLKAWTGNLLIIALRCNYRRVRVLTTAQLT